MDRGLRRARVLGDAPGGGLDSMTLESWICGREAAEGAIVYPVPFWREGNLSGQIVARSGIVQVTFDNTHPGSQRGVLLAFIDSHQARSASLLTPAARRAAVLDCLARYLGPRALEPVGYYEKSWIDDEWSRGCYTGIMTPGTWTGLGPALRAPAGPSHWAGTETATVWTGYMEGSGQPAGEPPALSRSLSLGGAAAISTGLAFAAINFLGLAQVLGFISGPMSWAAVLAAGF